MCTTMLSNRTLRFNIYINDFLTFKNIDICNFNFVGGTTPNTYKRKFGEGIRVTRTKHRIGFYLIRKQLHYTKRRIISSNSSRSLT